MSQSFLHASPKTAAMPRHNGIDIILPSLGFIGAQLYAIELAKKLAAIGYAYDFILIAKAGELLADVPSEKIIHCEPVTFPGIRILRVCESMGRLLSLLRRRESRTILAVTPFLNRILCFFKMMGLLKNKLIIESHQYPPREIESDYSAFWRLFYSKTFFLYKYANAHRTPSSGTHSFFVSLGHKNVHYAPNLIDLERIMKLAHERPEIDIRKRQYNVVSLGRLSKQKNLTLLIEAFSEVVKQTDAHLWVIGDGEERKRLQDHAERLGLGERVTFTGKVRNPYPLLRQADAFVLSSIWEGLPQTIVEAMALNVPVVSVDCETGPADMLGRNSERGWLVKRHDTAELAAQLVQALKSDASQEKARAAHEFALSEYDITRNIREYERLFL